MSVKRILLALFFIALFYVVVTPVFPYIWESSLSVMKDYNMTTITIPYMKYNASSHTWVQEAIAIDISGVVAFAIMFVYVFAPFFILWWAVKGR